MIPRNDGYYVLPGVYFIHNFAGSAVLAKVCALLSAILLLALSSSEIIGMHVRARHLRAHSQH